MPFCKFYYPNPTTDVAIFSVIDAIGKPPSGLLSYKLLWLGDYDECVKIEATVNRSGVVTVPYKGRYCKASFKLADGQVLSIRHKSISNLVRSPAIGI